MIPTDFKTSPAGLVPANWSRRGISKVASISYGISNPLDRSLSTGVRILTLPNVTKECRLDLSDIAFAKEETVKERDYLHLGDILFNWRNGSADHIGKTAIFELGGAYTHVGFLLRIRPDQRVIKPIYLARYLEYIKGKNFFAGAKNQVNKTFNKEELSSVVVAFPPLLEQEAIATIFSTWDRAIEKTETLIKAKERRKAGLMQRLLTGKVRFGEFAGETWKEMSIGKLLRQVKRPVVWDDDASYKLLSLRRASGGLFHRQTLRGSEILTKKMNTALEGDFLISKMQVVHGATGLTTAEFDGYHVSDSYLSYVARDPSTLDICFFNWLCKTKEMYHKAYRSSYGVHIEKMTFNPKLWLKETIMLPPTTEEQTKIVQVLDTAVAEIDEHCKQLAALKEQKKGLMQQLLTGKVRVKVS